MSEVICEPFTGFEAPQKRESLWSKAFKKFIHDKMGMVSFAVVMLFLLTAVLVWSGVIAQNWDALLADGQMGPSADYWFGTTINGQDIFQRAIYSTKTAFEVGLMVAIFATTLGALSGALIGYFSGSVLDEFILWIMNSIDCIPYFFSGHCGGTL